jgi:hypothetical protein
LRVPVCGQNHVAAAGEQEDFPRLGIKHSGSTRQNLLEPARRRNSAKPAIDSLSMKTGERVTVLLLISKISLKGALQKWEIAPRNPVQRLPDAFIKTRFEFY